MTGGLNAILTRFSLNAQWHTAALVIDMDPASSSASTKSATQRGPPASSPADHSDSDDHQSDDVDHSEEFGHSDEDQHSDDHHPQMPGSFNPPRSPNGGRRPPTNRGRRSAPNAGANRPHIPRPIPGGGSGGVHILPFPFPGAHPPPRNVGTNPPNRNSPTSPGGGSGGVHILPHPYRNPFAPTQEPITLDSAGHPQSNPDGRGGFGSMGGESWGSHIVAAGWQRDPSARGVPADFEEREAMEAAQRQSTQQQPPEPFNEGAHANLDDIHVDEDDRVPTDRPIFRGLRGVRIGYAGRGAYRGTGFGRVLMQAQGGDHANDQDAAEGGGETENGKGDAQTLRLRGGGDADDADQPTSEPSTQSTSTPEHFSTPASDAETSQDQEQGEGTSTDSNHVPRGLRGVRIGYAGRGAFRGTGVGRQLAGGFRGLPPRRGAGRGDGGAVSQAETSEDAEGVQGEKEKENKE